LSLTFCSNISRARCGPEQRGLRRFFDLARARKSGKTRKTQVLLAFCGRVWYNYSVTVAMLREYAHFGKTVSRGSVKGK
jgi:hypothetical protein